MAKSLEISADEWRAALAEASSEQDQVAPGFMSIAQIASDVFRCTTQEASRKVNILFNAKPPRAERKFYRVATVGSAGMIRAVAHYRLIRSTSTRAQKHGDDRKKEARSTSRESRSGNR